MEVKVCKNCRRLFKYMYGPDLCPDCVKLVMEKGLEPDKSEKLRLKPLVSEDEKMLEQVKDFIMTHPKSTITQIAEINEVPVTRIFEWIREERIEFSDDSEDAWFECEKCGTKIKSGRLCNRCKPIKWN